MGNPQQDYLAGTLVPNSLLPKLGRISVYFSYLDRELNSAIADLMGVNAGIGRTVTERILNISTRVGLLIVLAGFRFTKDEEKTRITNLKTQLDAAASDRNRLVHDEFFMGDASAPAFGVMKALSDSKKKPTTYLYDKEALNDLTDRIVRLTEFLAWLRKDDRRWLTEPLPSLDKSPTHIQSRKNDQNQSNRARQDPPPSSP